MYMYTLSRLCPSCSGIYMYCMVGEVVSFSIASVLYTCILGILNIFKQVLCIKYKYIQAQCVHVYSKHCVYVHVYSVGVWSTQFDHVTPLCTCSDRKR